jgi:para-aminobenzoate synthetase/4-amino-4-deoxychorismate lyase
LGYEAGYGLVPKLDDLSVPGATEHALWLAAFDARRELVGHEVSEHLAARSSRAEASAPRIFELAFDADEASYCRDFARIQAYLAAGESYQVCQSLRARFRFAGDAAALFARLRTAQPTSYSALIDTGEYAILSLSPELFFRKRGSHIQLKPMKGTAAAGADAAADAAIAERMRQDPKTRAENVMIVDLLRSDIGRIARPSSVQVPALFEVERVGDVLQMTSTIVAEVEPDLGPSQLFGALFPSGSVTGAPKRRTMQIIHELEQTARGIFCGSIGYVAPNLDACFNVAIRSLCLDRGGRGVLGVGSGIVVDSDAHAEHQECLLKAQFLTRGAW